MSPKAPLKITSYKMNVAPEFWEICLEYKKIVEDKNWNAIKFDNVALTKIIALKVRESGILLK